MGSCKKCNGSLGAAGGAYIETPLGNYHEVVIRVISVSRGLTWPVFSGVSLVTFVETLWCPRSPVKWTANPHATSASKHPTFRSDRC